MRETIERAQREIPFYAEHHRKTRSLDLHALPTCDKADLAPFGRLPLSARPLSDMYRVSATSGTTGPRLFIGYTEGDWRAIRDQYALVARCIGLERSDVLLNTDGGASGSGRLRSTSSRTPPAPASCPAGRRGRIRRSSGCASCP